MKLQGLCAPLYSVVTKCRFPHTETILDVRKPGYGRNASQFTKGLKELSNLWGNVLILQYYSRLKPPQGSVQ